MTGKTAFMPKGWVMTSVGDIYDIVGGGTPSTSTPEYWDGEIPWITSADILGLKEITPRKFISNKGVKNSATHVVPENSLIVVTRVGLGKIGLAKFPISFSQDSQALVGPSHLIYPEYALYYLSTAVQIFKFSHRGTTIAGVTKKQLSELSFPLPPVNEQIRIASKIQELFSSLDAAVASLHAVQAQLKRYRRAVLKAAFEGKLTQQWRENNDNKLRSVRDDLDEKTNKAVRRDVPFEVEIPKKLQKIALPEKWGLFSVTCLLRKGALIDVKDGNHGSNHPKTEDFSSEGLPFITASQMGTLEINYDSAPKLKGRPLDRLRVGFSHQNDVILSHKGTVGRVSVNKKECVLSPQTTYYRVTQEIIDPNFLAFYFSSPFFQNQLEAIKSQTTRDFVSISRQYALFVILAPILEQREVSKHVENKLSIIRYAERTIEGQLSYSMKLRQSILKNAFNGRLLTQNSTDEPAEKLLERIKFERLNNKSINNQVEMSKYV